MKNILENYLWIITESTSSDNPFYQDWINAKKDLLLFSNKHNPQMVLHKYNSKGIELKDIPSTDRKIIEEYNKKIVEVSRLGDKKNEWDTGIKRGPSSEEQPRRERPRPSRGEYARAERPSGGSTRSEYRGWSRTYNGRTYTNWEDYWRDYSRDSDAEFARAHYTYKGRTYNNFRDYWNAGAADRSKEFRKRMNKINRKFRSDMSKINSGGGYKASEEIHSAKVAAISLAILIILIAIRAYTEYYKQVHVDSVKFKGKNKIAYLRKHRIIGLQRQILFLRNSLQKANKTKDPEKFKRKINERINELNNRIMKLRMKIQRGWV